MSKQQAHYLGGGGRCVDCGRELKGPGMLCGPCVRKRLVDDIWHSYAAFKLQDGSVMLLPWPKPAARWN